MDHILIGVICVAVGLAIKVIVEGRKEIEVTNMKIRDCQIAAIECRSKTQETQIQIQHEQEAIPGLKEEVKQLESKQKTLEKRVMFWDDKYASKSKRTHQKDITEM